MAALGLDPLKFLYTRDDMEREIQVRIRDKALELKETLDRNLAIMIAAEVGKLFK